MHAAFRPASPFFFVKDNEKGPCSVRVEFEANAMRRGDDVVVRPVGRRTERKMMQTGGAREGAVAQQFHIAQCAANIRRNSVADFSNDHAVVFRLEQMPFKIRRIARSATVLAMIDDHGPAPASPAEIRNSRSLRSSSRASPIK